MNHGSSILQSIDVIRDWISQGAPEVPPTSVEAVTWGRVKSLYR